jgi:UDP-N-acetylmuramate dehydrogenase
MHSLLSYNTFGIQAYAKHLFLLETIEEVLSFIQLSWDKIIIGWGSNVLLTKDLEIVWINRYQFPPLIQKSDAITYVTVGSGMNRDEFVRWSLEQWLYGLENMALIPGTVWAWVLGNIGAYGREIADFIHEIEYIDTQTLETKTLTRDQCNFSYRWSIFKTMSDLPSQRPGYFISKVTFKFDASLYKQSNDYPDIQKAIEEQSLDKAILSAKQLYTLVKNIRTAKLPSRDEYGTAGSFFKHPIVNATQLEKLKLIGPNIKYFPYEDNYKILAGYLLEQLGYKWKIIWKVWCYRNQALILVNQGGSGKEIDEFAAHIEKDVFQTYGIQLEREVITL